MRYHCWTWYHLDCIVHTMRLSYGGHTDYSRGQSKLRISYDCSSATKSCSVAESPAHLGTLSSLSATIGSISATPRQSAPPILAKQWNVASSFRATEMRFSCEVFLYVFLFWRESTRQNVVKTICETDQEESSLFSQRSFSMAT